MASVRGALAIYDGMSGPIGKIHNAMNTLVDVFENAQNISSKAIDTAALQKARDLVADSITEWDQMEQNIRGAGEAQEQFNNHIRDGANAADNLGDKLKGVLTTVASIAGIKFALGWAKGNMELADTQRNAENQLKAVLANMGVEDIQIPVTVDFQIDTTQTMSAFDAIAAKASEIQGRGIYGDEAMIAGAAEFATYFSDAEAIISMMDTLANYAMGMSGGGELDSSAMVDYATNLGKIMTGAYDAMTKKGFEFSDAQKAVIEGTATHAQYVEALGADYASMSDDMRAATVINSIIAESWNGLYESMSNTPEGKIIQFNNTLGDVREVLGNQLYPAALNFFDVFTQKFPQIETVLTGFTAGLSTLITVLTWIAALGLDVATVFAENWGWIGPIIGGVAAALLAYNGALLAYNAIQAISAGITAISTLQTRADELAKRAQAGATLTAAESQTIFNAALLACPITWIVVGIIAIIAALYAGVGAVNKFAGTSVSATGIIGGAFAVLGAHVINTFIVPFWNGLAALANFIGNVFNDPVAAVKVLFYDMALTVIGYISNMAHAIEDVINKIPGVTVDITSGLDNFYKGLEEVQQKVKDESGWVEYVQKMDFIDYGEAASAGYKFGDGIEDTIGDLFKTPTLDEMGLDSIDAFNLGNTLDGIYGNTGDTAANTAAAADSLDYMDEDLKWMRDIAEREAINRYTTAEITVEQHNENYISKDTDLDGVMEAFCYDFAEKMESSGEGVHI